MPKKHRRRVAKKKNAKGKNVLIRCTEADKARWYRAAESATPSGQFSDWARQLFNAAADFYEKQRNRG